MKTIGDLLDKAAQDRGAALARLIDMTIYRHMQVMFSDDQTISVWQNKETGVHSEICSVNREGKTITDAINELIEELEWALDG